MEYEKKINYPSWKKPGTYPTTTRKELGLNNDDLEKFSLGNWNSIVSSKRIFSTGDFNSYPNEKGRPVSISFGSPVLENYRFSRVKYNKDENGNIIRDSITEVDLFSVNSIDNIPQISTGGEDEREEDQGDVYRQLRHFEIWGHYYTGADFGAGVWEDDRQFREEKELEFETTIAFIKPREPEEIEISGTGEVENAEDIAPLVFEFDEGGDMGLAFEREFSEQEEEDFTHELLWPRAFRFKSPTEPIGRRESEYYLLTPIVGVPQISDSGFWELNVLDYIERTVNEDTGNYEYKENLSNLGAPLFTYNFFLDNRDIVENLIPPSELFLVTTKTENGNEPLYYDMDESLQNYNDTSYPLKVTLNIELFNHPNFINEIEQTETPIDQLFYLSQQSDINQILGEFSLIGDINKSYFTYQIIQWGDEKTLLTDEQIKNTYFFSMYDLEEYPGGDNYFLKKWLASQAKETKPIQQISNHVYNTPGVKSIKIIVYRYDKSRTFLVQTYLVTKNIVINDGALLSQDFAIFGGTDFNFLPIGDNQAIIGGLDTDSNYNNSVSKIVKDDNFVQEDYLEKVSSKDYIKKFNNGLLGETPGQLDLSQTRVFTEPMDIYDFIGGDKLEWINQGSGSLPLNSLATDIFIRDDKCVVDLNPTNSEFLTIQNQMGTKEQGILIGDYKVNQPKDGRVQKQGVMQTPLLETDNDKQAF